MQIYLRGVISLRLEKKHLWPYVQRAIEDAPSGEAWCREGGLREKRKVLASFPYCLLVLGLNWQFS